MQQRYPQISYGARGGSWCDHCYVREDGVFIAEPYSLQEDAIEDLAFLAAAGWQVTVRASSARHYPGQTVAVEIQRPRP